MKFIQIVFSLILACIVNIQYSKALCSIEKNDKCNVFIQDTSKLPSLQIEQQVLKTMTIIYIPDTVNMSGLNKVFESAYGELFIFLTKNKILPGKVMAFYHNYSDPIAVEAAVEVGNVPDALTGRIKLRIVEGGNAVVVHYTGPYEEMETPYNALTKWLKDNHKKATGLPFEAYINDPSMVKDKYELKTDIYQLIKE